MVEYDLAATLSPMVMALLHRGHSALFTIALKVFRAVLAGSLSCIRDRLDLLKTMILTTILALNTISQSLFRLR